jgi:hypothetical protein
MANYDTSRLDPFQKEFVKLLQANAYRRRPHEVFRDFCELAAISLSNAVDRIHYEKREARYLEVIKAYTKEEVSRFPAMLAAVVNSLERGFSDSLGQLFMSLELGDQWKGQFFTPYEVALMMAKITLGDVRTVIERQGFFTVNEPAAGAGAMVIACAHELHDQGLDYQQCMHVIAQDIDQLAVHMAYIQCALFHIPAIIVHGNSLTVEEWDHWATPAHVLGFWDSRLRKTHAQQPVPIAPILPAGTDHLAAIIERRIVQAEQFELFA